MAQTYTLDEAANRLGMTGEEFKRRLRDEWKSIRSFRDGATLRFRSADIDELARSLGQASEPGLQMGPPGATPQTGSSDEFLLADPPRAAAGSPGEEPGTGADDIFSLAAGDSGKAKGKKPGDSDVRLESSVKPADAGPEGSSPTEEIALDLGGSSASGLKKAGKSSSKLKAPKSGPNLAGPGSGNKIPGPAPSSAGAMNTDSSSEFELSLDADSGSFELQLSDESEEVPIGESAQPSSRPGGQSGINLGKPADSGVSLEKKGKKDEEDSDDFELSLDPSDSELTNKLKAPTSSRLQGAKGETSESSEFELTLDDNSGVTDNLAAELEGDGAKGDIFETDFELPAVQEDADSGSEVVALESSDTDLENSDFDLALDEADAPAADESESQVVLLDDEGGQGAPSGRRAAAAAGAAAGAAAAARTKRPAVAEEEEEEESAAAALRGVSRRDEDEEEAYARPAAPAKWGALPAVVLVPCLIFTFLGGIMAFELINGMWGYNHGTQPGGTIVRGLAGMLDMDPKD